MLIDTTYFFGELHIPNLNKVDVAEQLTAFIEKYEEEFLTNLLGYEMYQDEDGDLFYGTEYDHIGRVIMWKGLIDEEKKLSVIANYVYYWWMRNNASQTTGVGETITKAENSVRTSPSAKMTRAWNEMAASLRKMKMFIEANNISYPGWSMTSDNWELLTPITL